MKKILVLLLSVSIAFSMVIVADGCGKGEVELSKYYIDATYNDGTLECDMTVNYINNTSSSVNILYFNLYPNAYREGAKIKPVHIEYFSQVYKNGTSYGDIKIRKVNCDNVKLDYLITGEDENILEVKLNSPVKPNKETSVFIEFTVTLANAEHRLGYSENTVNLTGFYPILCANYNGDIYKNVYYPSGDPFYSDVANYLVDLTVPSSYVVASSLSPTKTEFKGLSTTYSYSRENVRDIAFILSKNFNVIKGNLGDVEVSYYYFNDTEPERALDVIIDSLSYYSKNFCEYPYNEYVVCQADFVYGGMEYPCLTFIGGNLTGYDKEYCIAHETAHQWWYGLVGVNSSEEGFIDEGLTEYSTVLYLANSDNFNLSKEDLIETVKQSYRQIRDICVKNQTYKKPLMKRNLGNFSSDLEYVNIAYYRSQIMFDDLCNFMGEKKFLSAMQGLVNNYKYKNVSYDTVKRHFNNKKKGADSILDGYVLGETAI